MFDERAQTLRQDRAARRIARTGLPFFIKRSSEDAASRLMDINRIFHKALFIGDASFKEAVLAHLPRHKHPRTCVAMASIEVMLEHTTGNGTYDLIISNLMLQSANDPVFELRAIHAALKPDGLFLACLFGQGSLQEFRHAFYRADEIHFGGHYPRIFPFTDHTGAAALLSGAGFALPVIDIDHFTVKYKNLTTLVNDIRDIGQSNSLVQRNRSYLGRNYMQSLCEIYPRDQGERHFPVTVKYIWMTGWVSHQNQQKPLKPGSAQIGLSQALSSIKQR